MLSAWFSVVVLKPFSLYLWCVVSMVLCGCFEAFLSLFVVCRQHGSLWSFWSISPSICDMLSAWFSVVVLRRFFIYLWHVVSMVLCGSDEAFLSLFVACCQHGSLWLFWSISLFISGVLSAWFSVVVLKHFFLCFHLQAFSLLLGSPSNEKKDWISSISFPLILFSFSYLFLFLGGSGGVIEVWAGKDRWECKRLRGV